jgi:hypothetical protein
MRSLLILDSQTNRRQQLVRYLCEAGYEVCGISEAQYCQWNDYSGFDLVVVNFYPDAAGTWDFYMGLKKNIRICRCWSICKKASTLSGA